jgi:hypothetical protein
VGYDGIGFILAQGGKDMITLKKRPAPRQETTPAPIKSPAPERRGEAGGDRSEEIRLLAYRKWQEAGSPAGDGVEFWLTAEAEILRGRRR